MGTYLYFYFFMVGIWFLLARLPSSNIYIYVSCFNPSPKNTQEIHCPLVALAGDAVADPNWLLGVGLQRGWNSALDAVFYADNVYNNKTFNGKPPDKDEPIEAPIDWSEHMDNMMNLMQQLGNASRDSKLSSEMDTGMMNEKGPVVVQIRRQLKARNVEAPVPQYLPDVAPWGRYKEFQLAVNKNYKGKGLFENVHPLALRELAIFEHNERVVDKGALLKKKITRPSAAMLTWPKRFECSAFWGMMKLLEIDGKAAPGEKPLKDNKESAAAEEVEKEPEEPVRPKPNPEEVSAIAKQKSFRLRESIVLKAMSGAAPAGIKDPKDRGGLDALIFAAANRGQQMQQQQEEPAPEPVPAMAPPAGRRSSSVRRASMLSPDDMSVIANLTAQLSRTQVDGPTPAPMAMSTTNGHGGSDPLSEIRLQMMQYEKEAMRAKLVWAEKESIKVLAEQEALKAKAEYAEKEKEMIQRCLSAYESAEAKIRAMIAKN